VLHRQLAKATQLQFLYVITAGAALVRECGMESPTTTLCAVLVACSFFFYNPKPKRITYILHFTAWILFFVFDP